jgi:hypothetical protein
MTTLIPAHKKLIDAAARKYLKPLGCIQKGRSRTWLLDRTWFVSIVEFQPSAWAKGSYLNVGAHFLWSWYDHLSFDLGYRVEGFNEFVTEEQFSQVAEQLARRAVDELHQLDLKLPNLSSVNATVLSNTENPWHLYHCAVACGLSGKTDAASQLFTQLTSPSTTVEWQHTLATWAEKLLQVLPDRRAFVAAIAALITEHRTRLKLPNITLNPDNFAAGSL